jgi:hypothetical protein
VLRTVADKDVRAPWTQVRTGKFAVYPVFWVGDCGELLPGMPGAKEIPTLFKRQIGLSLPVHRTADLFASSFAGVQDRNCLIDI